MPLGGRAGARLADLCGLPVDGYLARFERVNLLSSFPGKAAKGDLFPIEEARASARALLRSGRLHGRPAVLLGGNVWRAFGYPANVEPFTWMGGGEPILLAFAPHPSGISLWWNEPENVARARRFFRRLARGSGPGPAAPRRRVAS